MTNTASTEAVAPRSSQRNTRAVAPLAVHRIGGLGASSAAGLRDRRLLAALDESRASRASYGRAADQLADALHAVVPRVDAKTRRSLLRLRRDLHNRRHPKAGDLNAVEGAAASEPALLEPTDRLRRELRRREATEAGVRDGIGAATEQAGAALASALTDTELLRGISLASPHAAAALEGITAKQASRPSDKRTRSALAYVVRAALKPGPLTTFTRLRLDFAEEIRGTVDADATRAEPHAGAADSLSLSLVHAMLLAPEARAALRASPNRSHRAGPLGEHMLLPMYQHLQERYFWRRDDVADAAEVSEALTALGAVGLHEDGALPVPELLAHLPPGWSARRAIECRLIIPVAPWGQADPHPLSTVAERLESAGGRTPAMAAAHVRSAVAVLESVPRMDSEGRRGAEGALRGHLKRAFTELGVIPPAHASGGDVLHEEVPEAGPSRAIDPGALQAAETSARIMRRHVFRSSLHDDVVAAVRAAYGTRSGPLFVDDVMEMLHRISRGTEGAVRSQNAMMKDSELLARARAEGRDAPDRPVRATPSLAPPSFFSVVQPSLAPDNSWVLDQISLLGPGSLARFRGLRTDDVCVRALADHYADRCVGRPIEVTTSLDQTSMQRQGSGVLPQLRWPVESVRDTGAEGLDIADLRVRFDVDDRVLITDAHGEPVTLVYSGVVPPSLVSGPVRNLLALSDPWALGFDSPERFDETVRLSQPSTGVGRTPRNHEGTLVVNREVVHCEPRHSPLGDASLPLHRLVADFDRWRADHNLGEELYVRVAQAGRIFDTQPKPLWLAVDAPHTLHLARRLVSHPSTNQVKLIEALPGAADIAAADGRARQYSLLTVLDPETVVTR